MTVGEPGDSNGGSTTGSGSAFREEDRSVEVDGATLAGTLTCPTSDGPWPVTLLLGGTFSDLRDADVDPRRRRGVPKRGMYKILAHGLAEAGIASYRFDRRGAGESTGEFGVERPQEVADAGAVWRWVRALPECNGKAAMLGHSAGAYVLCRVALEVSQPDAAVLQGALYRSIADLLKYNAGLVLDYMQLGEEQTAWVREHSRKAYEDALMLDATVSAIENGDPIAEAEIDGVIKTRDLSSLQYDLEFPARRPVPPSRRSHARAPLLGGSERPGGGRLRHRPRPVGRREPGCRVADTSGRQPFLPTRRRGLRDPGPGEDHHAELRPPLRSALPGRRHRLPGAETRLTRPRTGHQPAPVSVCPGDFL